MIQNPVNDLLLEAVSNGTFPSFSYLVSEKGEIRSEGASGMAVAEPESIPAKTDTIYDLASLTKPLVTGLLLAILLENKEVSIGDAAAKFLPALAATDKSSVTIRDLVSHASGLPAWRPFYLFENDPDREKNVLAQICAARFEAKPGARVIYSDLNFILLGFILQEITCLRYAEAARNYIFGPLGLSNSFFVPEPQLKRRIAASEHGNSYEADMCREAFPGNSRIKSALRSEIIWGEVHDGNCHYLGGASGHAGLFSNARETHLLAQQFLPGRSGLINPETCRIFRTDLTAGLNQSRSFSFQLAATKGSSAGPDLPPDAFGHPGFTGTSVWLDSRAERIYILLSNRTHAAKLPFADLSATRRAFHSSASFFLEGEPG